MTIPMTTLFEVDPETGQVRGAVAEHRACCRSRTAVLHAKSPLFPLLERIGIGSLCVQVERVTTHWNGYIAQVLGGWQDARDVYTRQIRLQELMGRPGFRVAMQQGPMQRVPTEVALTVPRQTA
jgi:hypothetical protein